MALGGDGGPRVVAAPSEGDSVIELPAPRLTGPVSVEEALLRRRSVRDFADAPLTAAELSQLLWAAQGITGSEGERTAPSAGALYPLEIYAAVGAVEGIPAGVYRYRPRGHRLARARSGATADVRPALSAAAVGQESVAEAAVAIVIAAVYERTSVKYGDRAKRYVHMEVGHAAQNVSLACEALGLGTVVVGAFEDAKVREVLGMDAGERPLAILPVGRRR